MSRPLLQPEGPRWGFWLPATALACGLASLALSLALGPRPARLAVLAGAALVAVAFLGVWTLERRRRQAEATLHERDLQILQAQKLEALGRLAGGVAHDINNYLAAIITQGELARRKAAADDPLRGKVEAMLSSAGKASLLVERLLAYGRRQAIRPEVLDLDAQIEDLRPMAEQLLGDGIALETALAGDLWRVEIDPAQVDQVLVNLLVNARQAMPDGGRVRVETANVVLDEAYRRRRPVVVPGEYVCLTVSDTGGGLSPELTEQVFEPFFTTRERPGSTGLGLATVYGIAKQNGGNVWAYGEPGHGAVFKLYLPRRRGAEDGDDLESTAIRRRREAPRGAGERVLLVEDNAEFRDSTRQLLAELGYAVTATGDGYAALEAWKAASAGDAAAFDVVISDVMMPGMGGRELAERLRADRPDLPVLFVSGYGETVIGRFGLLEAGVELLPKPFSAADLGWRVHELVTRRAETL